MFVKLVKVLSILVISIALIVGFLQCSDLSIEEHPQNTNYTEQSDGSFTSYFENGKISSEEFYKDGLRYGNWRFYHENGPIKKELNYKKGLLEGKQRYFSTTGKLIYTEIYDKGKLEEQVVKNDSLYNYEIASLTNGKKLFTQVCAQCHIDEKGEIIQPYYLEELPKGSRRTDSLAVGYFNEIHGDTAAISPIDSVTVYDVLAVIRYIDKQYQTAKKTPQDAVRLRKIRLNKKTPQL
jgi:mono/diheme cytochrome c family protein